MSGFTINFVALSGNLTRDPELRSTNSGVSVCSIRLAVNERTKNGATGEWEDRANYFDVTIWKGMGEWVANNLGKGDGITVSGRLRWREYDDKDGNKRQAVDVTADSIAPQRSGNGGGRPRDPDVPIDTADFAPVATGTKVSDDEIPF